MTNQHFFTIKKHTMRERIMKIRINYEKINKKLQKNQIASAFLAALLLTASFGSLLIATVPVGAVVVQDHELTVIIEPTGSGTVNPEERIYSDGTIVILIAAPLKGYMFSHWSGDIPTEADETSQTVPILMDSDKTITAHFISDDPEIEFCSSPINVAYFDQGLKNNGKHVDDVRSNPEQALGIPEMDDNPPINFVSLGFGGTLILEFEPLIGDGPGDDFILFETSYGDPSAHGWPEYVNVFVSQDNDTWYSVGEVFLDINASFDLGLTGLSWARYVKLVDNTDSLKFTGNADGYDVDGIGVINCAEMIIRIQKVVCNPEISVPEESIVMYTWEKPQDWPTMFKNELTEIYAQYDVMNGTYKAWCVDYGTNIPEGYSNPHSVKLYNSYQPPDHLTNDNWHKVNYILNHKLGDRNDVQRAIWYFVNFGSWDWNYTGYLEGPITENVYDMINDANNNSTDWCPECGDIIAVINDPGIEHDFQITIIEAILCEMNPGDDDDDDDVTPGDDDDDDDEPTGDDDDDDDDDDDTEIIKKSKKSSPKPIKINNKDPIAIISEPHEYSIDDQPITLDGSESYDPDTQDFIMMYKWNLGDGTTRSGKTVTHEYKTAGVYYVTLTVVDSYGGIGTMSTQIIVEQPNRAPEKPLIGGIMEVTAGETYSFAASSTDKDGDDIKYAFDWGDSTSDSSAFLNLPSGSAYSLFHTWSEPGEYTLTVTVTDGELSSSSEVNVNVNPGLLSAQVIYGALVVLFVIIFLIIFLILRRHHPKPTEN